MLFLLLILSMFCKLNFNLKASYDDELSPPKNDVLNTNQINLPVFQISLGEETIAYIAGLIHLNIEPSEELCNLIRASSAFICEERMVLPGTEILLDKKLEIYARDTCGIPRVGLDNIWSRLSTLIPKIMAHIFMKDITNNEDAYSIMTSEIILHLKNFNTFHLPTAEETREAMIKVYLKKLNNTTNNTVMKQALWSYRRARTDRDFHWQQKILTVLNSDTEGNTGPIFFAVGGEHVTRIINVIANFYNGTITKKRILYNQLSDPELKSMLGSEAFKNVLLPLDRLAQENSKYDTSKTSIRRIICGSIFEALRTYLFNNKLTQEELKQMEKTLNDPEILLETLKQKYSK